MSKWIDGFEAHPIHNMIEEITGNLQKLENHDWPDIESSDVYNRLVLVIIAVKNRLSIAVPELVLVGTLNNVKAELDNITIYVTNYIGDSNIAHLISANAHADTVLQYVATLYVPINTEDIGLLKDSVSVYKKSASQNVRHLNEDIEKDRSKLELLGQDIDRLLTDAAELKRGLDSALVEFQSQYSAGESKRLALFSENLEKWRVRFGELESDGKESMEEATDEFSTGSEALIESIKNEFARIKEEAEKQHLLAGKSIEQVIINYMDRLEEEKKKAEKIVNVISNTGMVGGYQKTANQDRAGKIFWNTIAVGSIVGLIWFAISAYKITIEVDPNWISFAGRAFVASAFGILTAYAAKLSDKYSESERHNRKMELELASIDPYLVSLPEDSRIKVKEDLAKRLFGQKAEGKVSKKNNTSGTSIDLAKASLDIVKDVLAKK